MSDAPPPGWGQPQGPPPGQGHPAQPPGGHGAPPPPPPGPPPFGQAPIGGSLPASGRPYDGQPGPPPEGPSPKGRGGLIAIIALVLIVVLGGIGIVLMLRAGSEDPDPVATATQGETPDPTDPTIADQAASDRPDPDAATTEPGIPTDGTAPPVTPTSPAGQESDPQAAAPQGTDQSVFDLAVGTCFDDPASQSEIQSVSQIPCEAPHDNEVFGLVEFPAGADDAFPGREVIAEYGDEQCQGPVFVDYVGVDYASSRYYASQLTPTEGSWEQGDREIVCILYDNLDQITGSVRGSAQ